MKRTEEQKEFAKAYEFLVTTAIKVLKISRKAAELRLKAIIKSGILSELGSPGEQAFQIGIDVAMRIPQLGESEE